MLNEESTDERVLEGLESLLCKNIDNSFRTRSYHIRGGLKLIMEFYEDYREEIKDEA